MSEVEVEVQRECQSQFEGGFKDYVAHIRKCLYELVDIRVVALYSQQKMAVGCLGRDLDGF